MEGRLKATNALQTAEAEIARLRADAEAREAALTTARMGRAAAEDALRDEQEARRRETEARRKQDEERAAEVVASRERQRKELEDADAAGFDAGLEEAEASYQPRLPRL